MRRKDVKTIIAYFYGIPAMWRMLADEQAELEVVSGYADGTFRPQQPITRGEMWTMAYRLLLAVAEPLVEDWAA